MMPKEVLTDRTIRAEVLPGLSLSRICAILERFQPDDFAADPLPRGMQATAASFTCPPMNCFVQSLKLVVQVGHTCMHGTAEGVNRFFLHAIHT